MVDRVLSVAIADDDLFVRKALGRYLSQEPDLRVAAECADGDEVLRLLASTQVDVLLLDLAMPRVDGMQVLAALRARGVQLPVVVLTGDLAAEQSRRVLAAGAAACLTKLSEPHQIAQAIRAAAQAGPAQPA